jgi:hypothetical protein
MKPVPGGNLNDAPDSASFKALDEPPLTALVFMINWHGGKPPDWHCSG